MRRQPFFELDDEEPPIYELPGWDLPGLKSPKKRRAPSKPARGADDPPRQTGTSQVEQTAL
jgi:hypothetical protein